MQGDVVLLCRCQGRIARSLPVDELCSSLRQDGTEVAITDDLCEPGAVSPLVKKNSHRPVAIGACETLRKRGSSLGLGPATPVVDVLSETKAPYSKAALVARAKLLLCAQIERCRDSFVPEEALRLDFSRPQGEITRRQLFRLPIPKSTLVPYVNVTKCTGKENCHLCQEACPSDAIEFERGKALIDKTDCSGCGACVARCPYDAIGYPTFSLEEREREMKGLLLANDLLEPRMLAVMCRTCVSQSESKPDYPETMLPLELPCLAMASPWLLLRAFDLGVQGLALLTDECRSGLDSGRWQGNVKFVQEVLAQLGIEPARLQVIRGDDGKELCQFAREVAQLGPAFLRFAPPVAHSADEWRLPTLIKGMGEKLRRSFNGTVSAGDVPFGKVEIDGSRCTGCGLCAPDCPTGALSFSSREQGTYEVMFWQQACPGCGHCVNSCPEGCLRLEKRLELSCLSEPPVGLLRDETARCRECGTLVAPQAMLVGLRQKLSGSGKDVSYLDLCPNCRVGSRLGLVRS